MVIIIARGIVDRNNLGHCLLVVVVVADIDNVIVVFIVIVTQQLGSNNITFSSVIFRLFFVAFMIKTTMLTVILVTIMSLARQT